MPVRSSRSVRTGRPGAVPDFSAVAWQRPPVFRWLADRGVAENELRRVFNLGVGMCAVVPEPPPGTLVIGELA